MMKQWPDYTHHLPKTVFINGAFFRLTALFVVAIASYVASSRLARRKNPSISKYGFWKATGIYSDHPEFALQVINSILEDGDQWKLLIVLCQMTKAFGGVQTVVDKAHLNPTQLYRTLSSTGNLRLSSFSVVLKAMGLRLALQPVNV